jgi:hypothetical protein
MKHYKSIITLSILAITASIVIFLLMRKNNQAAPPVAEDALTKAKQDQKAIMWDNYVPYIVEDDYKVLSSKASFTDTTSKVFKLDDIIAKRYKLVIRYSYIDCDLCVKKIMNVLKTVGAEQSLKDAIGFTNSNSDRDFLIRSRENVYPVKLYNVTDGSIGLYMENKNFPFMFVLTPEGRAIKFFTPSKENPEQITNYLRKALKFINTSNLNAKI